MISLFVVVSLLAYQLALASYVCPGLEDPSTMVAAMAAGEPCSGMDDAQPVLCHQHGANASQSFEPAKLATPSLPAIVQVLVVPPVLDIASSIALPVGATPEAWPPPNPVFFATLRLRV